MHKTARARKASESPRPPRMTTTAASPTGLLSLPDSLFAILWPNARVLAGMRCSKSFLKLLPAIVPDIVLRIKLDRAHDRFNDDISTDWDYKDISERRVVKSLDYFRSAKGLGLRIEDNGAGEMLKFNDDHGDGHSCGGHYKPLWLFLLLQQDGEERLAALEHVINGLHVGIYTGRLNNLASLSVNVDMYPGTLSFLIRSNSVTLKSVSLDGSAILGHKRMGGDKAKEVISAVSGCVDLRTWSENAWFAREMGVRQSCLDGRQMITFEDFGDDLPGSDLGIRLWCLEEDSGHAKLFSVEANSGIEDALTRFHVDIYGGRFKNLASLHVSVGMCSRALAWLIRSNISTLQSITLDGTMIPERELMGRAKAVQVMSAIGRCEGLQCLKLSKRFAGWREEFCVDILDRHPLLTTLTLDLLHYGDLYDLTDSICARAPSDFRLKVCAYQDHLVQDLEPFSKCLPHLGALDINLPRARLDTRASLAFMDDLHTATNMRTLVCHLHQTHWPDDSPEALQRMRDKCLEFGIGLTLVPA